MDLNWEDIDFKNNKIDIHSNLQYTPDRGIYLEESTKNKENRFVTISLEIMRILNNYRREQLQYKLQCGDYWTETGSFFTQDNGTPMHPDSLNKWLREFTKRYNLPHINPHKFRHTQASLLYYSGEDPITISKRLGHKQVSTTQNIYSHVLKGADERASDKIADMLYRNNNLKNKAK